MAAGPAIKMWSRNDSEASSENGIKKYLSFREGYSVTLDASDPIETVYQAAGLPLVGYSYPTYPTIFCKSLKPDRQSPILAFVDVKYSGEFSPSANVPGSPATSAPPEISWSDVESDDAVDEDWYGKPVVNANREPIDGGLKIKVVDQVLTVKRNFLAINTYAIRQYRRAVNSDWFAGWPPGTARLVRFNAKQVINYWEVTAQIQFREPYRTTPEKAWYRRVLHQGYYIRSVANGPIFRAPDDLKESAGKPVLLRPDGTHETNQANANWLEFKVFGELPYNQLGLL